MNPAVLQRTQDTLGKVIRKPPLTERLLSKPPFRYLHDVIGEVIRTTDFMKGLYTESELKSDNVKDKEAKISFLQKAVDVVTIVLGEPLSVKPARVIAGHEPEKTNELLQAIGKCCLSKLSSEDAVKKVLAGERPDLKGKPSSSKSQDKENIESKEDERKSQKDREERKASEIRDRSASRERKARDPVKEEDKRQTEKGRESEQSREKDAIREEEKPDPEKRRVKAAKPEKEKERTREKDREKGHEKDRRSEGGKGKERDKDRTKEREKDKGRERDKELERDKDPEKRRDRTKESERKSRGTEESIQRKTSDASAGDAKSDADKELSSPPKTTKHSAGRGTRRQTKLPTDGALEAQSQERGDKITVEKTVEVSGEKKPRETTPAQLGESGSEADETEKLPAVVNGETSEDLSPQAPQRRIPRPNSARPAPPRVKRQGSAEIPPPVRVSSGTMVSSVIVEKSKEDEDEDEQFVVEEAAPLPPEIPEMEMDVAVELDGNDKHGGLVKRILETKKDYDAQQPLAKTTEKTSLSEAGRKKEKDLVSKEIEKLRSSIQTVCRSALPLGKIMDYIQEDMDAMQNELQTWRSENKVHAEALLREQSITDSAVEPLRIELANLEQLIKEQQDKICTVKANILRNEEKIQKMVFSISASSRT